MNVRYEKMCRDMASEFVDFVTDSAARNKLNSVPMPTEAWEIKLENMIREVVEDVSADLINAAKSTPHRFADGTEVTFLNVGKMQERFEWQPLKVEGFWGGVWNFITNSDYRGNRLGGM